MIGTRTAKTLSLLMALIFTTAFLFELPVLADENGADTEPQQTTEQTAEETPAVPVNVSENCVYVGSVNATSFAIRLPTEYMKSWCTIPKGGFISITWDDTVDVDFVFYQFIERVPVYTVETLDAEGNVLSSAEGKYYWNDGLAVDDNVRAVRLSSPEEMLIFQLAAYSGGAPVDYHPWRATPEKTDFMIISTHPDDDVLFMGAVMPIYGAEKGYEGTIVYMTASERKRDTEALNGAWEMGLRTYPLFAGMPDIISSKEAASKRHSKFNDDNVTLRLVQYIRQMKPEIVVTHDLNGEYGHFQHKIVAKAAQNAMTLAADETYDPESVEMYGVWQVKKLYLHLFKENTIQLDPLAPLAAFDGASAMDVAAKAYGWHKTQNKGRHQVTNEGVASLADFGLAFTTVGPDVTGGDMFENIPTDIAAEPKPAGAEETLQETEQAPAELTPAA